MSNKKTKKQAQPKVDVTSAEVVNNEEVVNQSTETPRNEVLVINNTVLDDNIASQVKVEETGKVSEVEESTEVNSEESEVVSEVDAISVQEEQVEEPAVDEGLTTDNPTTDCNSNVAEEVTSEGTSPFDEEHVEDDDDLYELFGKSVINFVAIPVEEALKRFNKPTKLEMKTLPRRKDVTSNDYSYWINLQFNKEITNTIIRKTEGADDEIIRYSFIFRKTRGDKICRICWVNPSTDEEINFGALVIDWKKSNDARGNFYLRIAPKFIQLTDTYVSDWKGFTPVGGLRNMNRITEYFYRQIMLGDMSKSTCIRDLK